MRIQLSLFLMLISLNLYGQIFTYGDPPIISNVESLIERSNKHKNDWREYSFDSSSRITEIKYFRDSILLEHKLFYYESNGDSAMKTTEINISSRGTSYYNSIYFYDSNKRIIRYELFKENTDIPMIVELNTKYVGDKIKEFDRILIPHDTSVIEHYIFSYLKNKTIINKTDNKQISQETVTIEFDDRGNCIKKTVDYNNPETVLAGVRTYSHSRKDKYEIIYKNDKNGNWIQSYSKTRLWKFKIDHRIIKYK